MEYNPIHTMVIKRCLLWLLFFFMGIILNAQKPDMYFSDIPNSQNLSSSFATCITQDTTGFIWIGTQDGLNRYDGYTIKIYRKISGDTSSISHNNITYLYTDSRGRLWIGTHLGICIYNPDLDNFIRVVQETNYAGMSSINISRIYENRAGTIFVSSGGRIYLYDEQKKDFGTFFTLQKGDVGSFLFDSRNNLWIGASKDGGLVNFNLKTGQVRRFLHDATNKNSLSHNYIFDIALKDNKLWIATYGGGINSYDISKKIFKRYPENDPYSLFIKSIYIDNDGRIWACNLEDLKLYEDKCDNFYEYHYVESDEFTLKMSPILIYQDRQGDYWTLHSPGGIGFRVSSKGFRHYTADTSYLWHTSRDNITAIATDQDGNLWLGNYNEGIDVFTWKDRSVTTYMNNPKDKHSLGQGTVGCIFRDRYNRMWVGTNMGGLQYFDTRLNRFVSYVNDPKDTLSIANNDIRYIEEDAAGNLWLAAHGKDIERFDRNSGVFHHYTVANNNLSNEWVFQILADSKGNLWAATAWGLSMLRPGKDQFTGFYYDDNDSLTISNNEVLCLFEDSRHNIWVGTANGLNLYDAAKNNFHRFFEGIKNPYICSIQEDSSANIWISTLGGLTMINPETKRTVNFDIRDGLRSNEFNPRSVLMDDQGKLYFGGIKGVTTFIPEELRYNNTKPNVVITALKLFNREVTDYSKNSILQKHISLTKKIVLKYKENAITLEYVALNMIQPEKNQYKYMLEGFENNWNQVGNKREAVYTNLNPGSYTFRVIASNNDGVWNTKGAELQIQVLPPWWMTIWFKLFITLLVSGLFIMFYLVRTAQLRNQKNKLEILVNDKTKELREKNELLLQKTDDLNNINTLLELRQIRVKEQAKELKNQAEHLENANTELASLNSTKDKLFSIIAHDLRNPFNTILGFSDLLSKNLKDLEISQITEIATCINISSQQVFNLLDNLLKWAFSQLNKVQFNPDKLSFDSIVSESIEPILPVARQKGIELVVQENTGIHIFADLEMVKTVVRNLISNAIKFTPKKGKVTISVEISGKFALVSVADTGVGMDMTTMDNLFVAEKTEIRQGTEGEKGSGLGLLICKEFIEKNGGKLNVYSKEKEGSTFSFTVPTI